VEIFLDTANVDEITKWLDFGVLDGVTTNPSILLKEGGNDMEGRVREIAKLINPRPLSVEVSTNDSNEMIQQANAFAEWAPNIVVKIPVLNEYGVPSFGVVNALEKIGIRVNMTAVLSFGQMAMGAKAGATYISIFAGRVSDEGNDSTRLIQESVNWLAHWNYPSKIIVGSIREAINIQDAAMARAHIITAPPQFLLKWVDHYYTRATVRTFNEDAKEAAAKMAELKLLAS
jgi:transaldolase